MRVTPLVLIQILSKRTWVGRLKCGSDPRDEGQLACLPLVHGKEASSLLITMFQLDLLFFALKFFCLQSMHIPHKSRNFCCENICIVDGSYKN